MNPWTGLVPAAAPPAAHANPYGLTARQVEVVDAVTRAGTNEGAAAELGMEAQTVAQQVMRARKKMGVDNRTQLAVKWALWRAGVQT